MSTPVTPTPTPTPPTTGPDAAALATVPAHRTVSVARPLIPMGAMTVTLPEGEAVQCEALAARAVAAGLTPAQCLSQAEKALRAEFRAYLRGTAPAAAKAPAKAPK